MFITTESYCVSQFFWQDKHLYHRAAVHGTNIHEPQSTLLSEYQQTPQPLHVSIGVPCISIAANGIKKGKEIKMNYLYLHKSKGNKVQFSET